MQKKFAAALFAFLALLTCLNLLVYALKNFVPLSATFGLVALVLFVLLHFWSANNRAEEGWNEDER